MINENSFLSKLLDSYIFVKELAALVDSSYIQKRAIKMTDGIEDIIADPRIWKDSKFPTKEKISELITKMYNINTAKVENYRKWIYGYGLVLLCAIFDDFLINLLTEILEKNPDLTKWTSKIDIISRFNECNIKEKCNIYTSKLGFSEKEFFDFKMFIPDVQREFNKENFATLNTIYKKRNLAAHSDRYVMYDIESLDHIRGLFEKLIWVLSIKSMRKWNIDNLIILANKQA